MLGLPLISHGARGWRRAATVCHTHSRTHTHAHTRAPRGFSPPCSATLELFFMSYAQVGSGTASRHCHQYSPGLSAERERSGQALGLALGRRTRPLPPSRSHLWESEVRGARSRREEFPLEGSNALSLQSLPPRSSGVCQHWAQVAVSPIREGGPASRRRAVMTGCASRARQATPWVRSRRPAGGIAAVRTYSPPREKLSWTRQMRRRVGQKPV